MRIRVAVLIGVLVLLVACGGDDSGGGSPTTTAAESTTVSTFGGTPGAAQRVACEQDVRTFQQASDMYAASHGSLAPSIDALIADGGVSGPPSSDHGYVIAYDAATGHVSATGACTVP